ncbi:hypothetical protein Dip510_000326 [Elusimicrobium posterum]|uniref:hypothetical protein n=1 Tax=Elusimicrobium posterum TaxID=3116653 RepID=UPI003C766148
MKKNITMFLAVMMFCSAAAFAQSAVVTQPRIDKSERYELFDMVASANYAMSEYKFLDFKITKNDETLFHKTTDMANVKMLYSIAYHAACREHNPVFGGQDSYVKGIINNFLKAQGVIEFHKNAGRTDVANYLSNPEPYSRQSLVFYKLSKGILTSEDVRDLNFFASGTKKPALIKNEKGETFFHAAKTENDIKLLWFAHMGKERNDLMKGGYVTHGTTEALENATRKRVRDSGAVEYLTQNGRTAAAKKLNEEISRESKSKDATETIKATASWLKRQFE